MPSLVAIADLTHPLQNNLSSIGTIGCYLNKRTERIDHQQRRCQHNPEVQDAGTHLKVTKSRRAVEGHKKK